MSYKKVAKCPDELNEIIKLVNSLPESIYSTYSELNKEFEEETQSLIPVADVDTNAKLKLLFLPQKYEKKTRELLSEEIYHYVVGIFETSFDSLTFDQGNYAQLGALEKLKELLNLKDLLFQIAELTRLEFEVGHPNTRLTFQPLISFGLSKDGHIKPFANPIVNVFIKYDIQIERICLCPICKKIFWAKRREAPTCPKKRCSNAYHQRKLRIKEYEKRYVNEVEKLKKQKSILSESNPLIEDQYKLINKLEEKIKTEKIKNGTL